MRNQMPDKMKKPLKSFWWCIPAAVYPYFAIGSWQNLCVIPVTEDTLKDFEQKGVLVKEIP